MKWPKVIQGVLDGLKPKPPQFAETPFGQFKKDSGSNDWEHWVVGSVYVHVNDVDGAPDGDFVARLPDLLAKLPHYVELARAAVDFNELLKGGDEGAHYEVFSLSQGSEGTDFELHFEVENEKDLDMEDGLDLSDGYYSVFVSFAKGQVSGHHLAH